MTWHGHLGRDAARAGCPCHILSVLRDPTASRATKAEALKFVVHFTGDLHQPLHDEDNGDRGGNERQVIFNGHPDNLHWVWDTGLLERLGDGDTANRITLLLSLLMVATPVSPSGQQAPTTEGAPKWDKPITLFHGRDFTEWEFSDPSLAGSWKVEQGMPVSSGRGSNLMTARKFGDFKLHLEFNCAPKSNSGVYVQDRYADLKWLEVRIGTDSEREPPSHHTGAIYARLAPSRPSLVSRAQLGLARSFALQGEKTGGDQQKS